VNYLVIGSSLGRGERDGETHSTTCFNTRAVSTTRRSVGEERLLGRERKGSGTFSSRRRFFSDDQSTFRRALDRPRLPSPREGGARGVSERGRARRERRLSRSDARLLERASRRGGGLRVSRLGRNHGSHRVEKAEVRGRRQRLHACDVPGSVARGAPVLHKGRHARAPPARAPSRPRASPCRRTPTRRRASRSSRPAAASGGTPCPSRAARTSPKARRRCSSPPLCLTE
jgi:hypothetical protein